MTDAAAYGLLAEFDSPEALIDAVRRTRQEGYRTLDAFTPFPVEGLAELLDFRDRRVLWLGLGGACLGFATAIVMQVLINVDYPLDVGGRPVQALSAFAVVAFELTILFSALATAIGMLCLNGLPRLSYPVFAASRIHLASKDRFFLCVKSADPRFHADRTAEFLRHLGAASVELVPA